MATGRQSITQSKSSLYGDLDFRKKLFLYISTNTVGIVSNCSKHWIIKPVANFSKFIHQSIILNIQTTSINLFHLRRTRQKEDKSKSRPLTMEANWVPGGWFTKHSQILVGCQALNDNTGPLFWFFTFLGWSFYTSLGLSYFSET